jgi:hypothetical protein
MLWDYSNGGKVVNLTKLLYDFGGNTSDFEENGMDRLNTFGAENRLDPYVESATFWKLRELSVGYRLPTELVQQLGPMTNAHVSLSGRNLLTISDYSGYDPEVSVFGNQPVARGFDVAPYGPSRSYWFSVTADF